MLPPLVGCALLAVAFLPVGQAASSTCSVSRLNPVKQRPEFELGTTRLAVSLPKNATHFAPKGWVERDGSIRIKVGWLSPSGGPRGFPNGGPLVTGRRLDRPAAPLRVRMGVKSFALGSGEFYPSSLHFPTVGCWRITAQNAKTSLTFTVRLVRR